MAFFAVPMAYECAVLGMATIGVVTIAFAAKASKDKKEKQVQEERRRRNDALADQVAVTEVWRNEAMRGVRGIWECEVHVRQPLTNRWVLTWVQYDQHLQHLFDTRTRGGLVRDTKPIPFEHDRIHYQLFHDGNGWKQVRVDNSKTRQVRRKLEGLVDDELYRKQVDDVAETKAKEITRTASEVLLDQSDKLVSAHMELDKAKQQALDHAATLYHQTDRNAADIILQSQTMRPGNRGVAGPGIYFATNPQLTMHKALSRGVILQAKVSLGQILELERDGDPSMTHAKLRALGKDSVCINRGSRSGLEYVVYEADRVLEIREHSPAA